jgi:hypothetical protein
LKADVSEAGERWSDGQIIEALETSVSMVYRVRKQFVEEGFEAVLSRKQRRRPAVARIFDGEKEAKLIALACSKPPKGRVRWTLRLLENKVVELNIVDRASDSTIGRTLNPSAAAMGHPAEGNSAFVAAMEDVLAVYPRPRDPDRPLVCVDETSKQLHAETRGPIPMKAGRPARFDCEYERNGTANLFMMFCSARRLAPRQSYGSSYRRTATEPRSRSICRGRAARTSKRYLPLRWRLQAGRSVARR